MARPAVACGRARLKVLAPDRTTVRGYLSLDGGSWNWSNAPDGSSLSFTANHLEAALVADPDMLVEAFAIVQLDVGGVWVDWGTPYALAPGAGRTVGPEEGSAKSQSPVSVGAMQALLSECIVLPTECDETAPTFRRTGGQEENRYLGWQSKGYQESLHPTSWHDADIYTPDSGTSLGTATVTAADDHFALTAHGLADDDRVRVAVVSGCAGLTDGVYQVTVIDADTFTVAADITSDGTADVFSAPAAKYGEPENWDANAAAADWVFRDAAEGGLTLCRFGTFTVASRTVVKFIVASDEEGKLYLDGPNQGGVIIDMSGDETGYTEKTPRRMRLEAGTYRVSAEFTTVDSTGGDGNDSIRFACGTIDDKGNIASVLLASGASTRVHRQNKSDERPGMSPMEVLRRLLQENSDQGVTGADILLDGKDFTDPLDSAGGAPSEADCREWVWPLGAPLASVVVDMVAECDLNLTTGFVFQCFLSRGTDLSATVGLVQGAASPTATMNLLEYGYNSDPAGPTRYLTLSQDGFDIVVGTSAETDSARPRFGFFETGASASIGRAKSNARTAIAQTGHGGRLYERARLIAVTGHVPGVDTSPADTIAAFTYLNAAADRRITDIGGEQDECSVEFTYELTEP